MPDALQLIREDHRNVQNLFKRFEQSDSPDEKLEIARNALLQLLVHAKMEEDLFYPAMRRQDDVEEEMMDEAEEEHESAERLIYELKDMTNVDSRYEATFKVLSEQVIHHIEEEES